MLRSVSAGHHPCPHSPAGNVEAKQEEIRKRLQLAGKDSKPSLAAAQDYYTSTEMAQFQQPKKKRVRVFYFYDMEN